MTALLTPTKDLRFDISLYTVPEAAWFLGVGRGTLADWAHGYRKERSGAAAVVGGPIITAFRAERRAPSIPFVGLAEGLVVAAFRRAGVSLQHIRKAVAALEREIGLEHALASEKLFTDGASVLYDYAERHRDEREALTHVVTQQRVFTKVVEDYLQRITYGSDGYPTMLFSPVTERPIVAADPTCSFGQPMFVTSGARVEDVLDRWQAGEPLAAVAADFGVPLDDVEDVLRASRAAVV